ncbi:DgyrCDS10664 [Dimorphilus gyrociliatus]|uniref:DgyrCDS10664 n=1 Tax=Dimorphilus gyrociliatus TaxID=2664684 RepID=A0A7I8W104_9ANNE|nr:DgyrCDS10664 [Dimorphilus gyrociliatus]
MAYDLIKRVSKEAKGRFTKSSKTDDRVYETIKAVEPTVDIQLQSEMHCHTTIYETINYWWSNEISSIKGNGATASVYEGRNKTTGERVAIKVFSRTILSQYDRKNRKREFAAMKAIKHKNVVQLKGIERIKLLEQDAIIMELCECSLATHLARPENHYGLEESDFLTVVGDVTSGLKYLRNLKYIHRDIKPGNIMRYVEMNGKVTYKLGDFGASRKLDEGENFQSLYGTDEYLHPDIYVIAKLDRRRSGSFDESVDLWSLGCTFYHCASNELPFRPFGGRKAIEAMVEMHAKKPKGVLSMYQKSENSEFITSEHLPRDCRLSSSLKSLIEPLLAKLLETDRNEIISFDSLFYIVDDIMTKSRIPITIVNQLKSDVIFVPNENTFEKFTNILSEQTSIDPNNLLLIWNSTVLSKSHSIDTTTITKENPLLVFQLNSHGMRNDKTALNDKPIQLKTLERKRRINVVDVKSDLKNLKEISISAYSAYLYMTHLISMFRQCLNIPNIVEEYFQKSSIQLHELVKKLDNELTIKSNSFELVTIINGSESCSINISEELEQVSSEVNYLDNRLENEIKHFESQFQNPEYSKMKETFSHQKFPDLLSVESSWDSTVYQVFMRAKTLSKEIECSNRNEIEKYNVLSERNLLITNIMKCNEYFRKAFQYSQDLHHCLNSYIKYIVPFLENLNDIQQSIQNIQHKIELLSEQCDIIVQECLSAKKCKSKEFKSQRVEEVEAFSMRMDNIWAAPRKVGHQNRWISVNLDKDGQQFMTTMDISSNYDSAEEEGEEDNYYCYKSPPKPFAKEKESDDSDESDTTHVNDNDFIKEEIENILKESKNCRESDYLEENEKLSEQLSQLIESVKNSNQFSK